MNSNLFLDKVLVSAWKHANIDKQVTVIATVTCTCFSFFVSQENTLSKLLKHIPNVAY